MGGEFFNIQCLSLPHVKIGKKVFQFTTLLNSSFSARMDVKRNSGRIKKWEEEEKRERERDTLVV